MGIYSDFEDQVAAHGLESMLWYRVNMIEKVIHNMRGVNVPPRFLQALVLHHEHLKLIARAFGAKRDARLMETTMDHIYKDGEPDTRQLTLHEIPDDCKLFRKRYRQLTDGEIALHDAIKDKADELAGLIAQINNPPKVVEAQSGTPAFTLGFIANNNGAHVTLALRHLEDCVYRAVKALTA